MLSGGITLQSSSADAGSQIEAFTDVLPVAADELAHAASDPEPNVSEAAAATPNALIAFGWPVRCRFLLVS